MKNGKKQQFVKSVNKTVLLELYHNNSVKTVAALLNVSYKGIIEALHYYDIPLKTRAEIAKLDSTRAKLKNTNLQKYGVEEIFVRQDVRQHNSSTDARKKAVQTTKLSNLQKYGVESTNYLPEVKSKLSESNKKYGAENYNNRLQTAQITCHNKYGVSNYAKSNEFKQFYRQHATEFKEKEIETKRAHNSFNVSKPEDYMYICLCQQYAKNDVIRQYKDVRYPFYCDFYIRSQDLYIECNFHGTHGGMPFDEHNIECQNKLKIWKEKEKTSKFYQTAIYVGTILDTKKQKIAEENKLNYKVIYNYNKNYILNER